jgi:hypothetical protein
MRNNIGLAELAQFSLAEFLNFMSKAHSNPYIFVNSLIASISLHGSISPAVCIFILGSCMLIWFSTGNSISCCGDCELEIHDGQVDIDVDLALP